VNPRVLATAALAGILLAAGFYAATRSMRSQNDTMSTQEADSLIQEDSTVVLLDVRTEGEFSGPLGHLRGAILIPVQELEERVGELEQFRGRTIIAYCRTGNRSGFATTFLRERGFTAWNMAGGMVRWNAERRTVAGNGRDE
jgi:rhodanese-related sulfurtransferase